MKKIILTFIVAALSLATSHAQLQELSDPNTLLILFPTGTSSTVINQKKLLYQVTNEIILPNTGVRIWTIQLPIISLGLSTIIDVSNHANSNTQMSKSSPNLKLEAPPAVLTHPIKDPSFWAKPVLVRCPNGTRPITVAIADCGFSDINNIGRFDNNPLHDELFINRMWNTGAPNYYLGKNFVSNNNIPKDDHIYSHGTRINGIIAQTLGTTGFNNVKLMNLKTQDRDGKGSLLSLIKAIDEAMGKNVKIMNLSLQYKAPKADANTSILGAVIELARIKNDMLFVVAAGNRVIGGVGTGRNLDHPDSLNTIYPAYFRNPNMIVVAAADELGRKAAFSNYGVTSVDIAAPGCNINSTTRYGWDDSVDSSSGTSFATAFVTATAAMVGSMIPWSSSAVKQIILITATRPAAPNAQAWDTCSVSRALLNINAARGCVSGGSRDLLPEFSKLNNVSTEVSELLTTFPNPFSDMAQIKITTEKDVEATLTIQNAYGQIVLNQKMVLKGGENVFEWQANEAVKGIYIVKVQLDSQTLTQKIVKQ
jgi:Subtilase family/Secretion system C-terminal sorting domain